MGKGFFHLFYFTDYFTYQGALTILGHYGGSYVEALVHLFPNIGLDKSKFSVVPSMQSEENKEKNAHNK
jgi:hypothetical protein